MNSSNLRKITEAFLFFLTVSVIGWLYEVFLEVAVYRWGFSNRGVLFGPYCVIYGFGGLLLLVCLYKLTKQQLKIGRVNIMPLLVFAAIVAITTITELVGSYIMEWTHGEWLWDYTRFWLNFEGRIAPNPSLRFGLGGMLILYLIYPLFHRQISRLNNQQIKWLSFPLAIIFLTDCLLHIF